MNLNTLIGKPKTEIIKDNNTIILHLIKTKSKFTTNIEGISFLSTDPNFIKDTSVHLKKTLCCGASIKNNIIELQGDHVMTVKKYLIVTHKVEDKNIVIKGK